ncbi:MAG: dihydrolipoyl dehydrogenase [Candidatus Sumerlaeia bacterium]|nr:dihydrolipoyl dehydrogenase [Candidatus Sumerlaeia bacterium]
MSSEYDLIVIGAGPAGYVGAIHAAKLGMKTAVVECDRVGGVCLNWGCIPTKTILHCAEAYELALAGKGSRADCGIRGEAIRFDFAAVMDQSRRAADRLARGIEGLFRTHKIDLLAGRARLADPQTVQVFAPGAGEPQAFRARNILLATGARARLLPGLSADGQRVLTSREALTLHEVPRSLLVVGAGAIGLEFAYAFACYGCKVTVVEMESQILPEADKDQATELERALMRRGVTFLTGSVCCDIQVSENGIRATVGPSPSVAGAANAASLKMIEAEKMLVAVGVLPNSEALGLEGLGIEQTNGFVKVGDDLRTACETVWAAGDLIGPPLLAHAASAEAIAAVEAMADRRRCAPDRRAIAMCVYCQPEAASVGWTEKKARAAGLDVGVAKMQFLANGKAVATGLTDGFVKILFDKKTRALLGCHIVGHSATELIHTASLALSAGLRVDDLARMVFAHPTRNELLGDLAREVV